MSRFKPKRRATAATEGASDPAGVTIWAEQAERLLSEGQSAEAERVSRAVLAKVPTQALALMIASVVCMSSGRTAEAEALLRRGAAAHPQVTGFHAALGRLLLESNRPAEALLSLENCVLLEPENRDYRVALVALYQTRTFASFSEASRLAMLACLADASLTHSSMHRAWLSLLRLDPSAAGVFELFDGCPDYASFCAKFSPERLDLLRGHALIHAGLNRFLAADLSIERGLTWLRRWFVEDRERRIGRLELIGSLAQYCSLTEFVFQEVEDWHSLRREAESAESIALLACYEVLARSFTLSDLPRLATLSNDPCFRALLRTSLEQPIDERRVRDAVPTLGSITDPVSQAVRDQYEENPYPRWTTVGNAVTSAEDAEPLGRGKRILIAGCGTGREAVQAALTYPDARVDAFDLSRTSLAYATRQASGAGLSNLAFAQADILELGEHPRRYDLIVASGVLHHLSKPEAGLRALLRILRSRGILRIGLYSRLARAPLEEARRLIRAHGFSATPPGIRAFRAAVDEGALSRAARDWLTHSYDFYSLSQCRDLVFHVQEHEFDLFEIARLLSALELAVLHLELKSPVHEAKYRARFPNDPSATRLENWAALEAIEPNLFAGMYDLWLCRISDREALDASWLGV